MLYILYSNDYEVFLGGNFRPETEVLIEPSERVLEVCEEIGVPMTLFADVAWLWRYRELGRLGPVRAVEDQMCRALARGHDVQAHIHPHWGETQVESDGAAGARYRFDRSRFLLGNFGSQDQEVHEFALEILSRARAYLMELLRSVDSNYRCVAYRAGGYGLQPHTAAILAALEQSGLIIDSSVVPGMTLSSNVNRIDFGGVPARGNYYLSAGTGLSAPAGSGIFEIPVLAGTVGRFALLQYVFRRAFKKLLGRSGPAPSGYAIQMADRVRSPFSRLVERIRSRLREVWRGWAMLEATDDAGFMLELTRRYINRYGTGDGDLYFSFSCHSKCLTPASLKALKAFHWGLERRYGSQLEAVHFQEAARRLPRSGFVRTKAA